MGDFAVTLKRDLPLVDGSWDGPAAKQRVFAWATNAAGEFDAAKAADAFLIADTSTGLKGDLHMGVADIIDGRLTIVGNGLRAALSRLGQDTPFGVPAEVRERAADVARGLLDKLNERSDGHPGSISVAVMLPVPPELAVQFPGRHGIPPHVTLVHVPKATWADANRIVELATDWQAGAIGETLTLGALAYFDLVAERVAYASVDVSAALRAARDLLAEAISEVGIDVSRPGEEWVPHATIGYLTNCTEYMGVVPVGSWDVDRVEVWADGVRQVVDECARADRSDEEKADIRERWQGPNGPNMSPSEMDAWGESRFAGPNRKSGDERERARRVFDRARRLIDKPLGEWDEGDYDGAAQVLAFIERMSANEQGPPLSVDGVDGPSARDASLKDWGFNPRKDSISRADAARIATEAAQQALFQWQGRRTDRAPAVHTESRLCYEVVRADKAELSPPTPLDSGWRRYPILYSRADIVQEYNENGRRVREYRDAIEPLRRKSMDSGVGVPWELRHSKDLLNPDSVVGVAQGAVLSVDVHQDGIHTAGHAVAWGRDLFDAIDDQTAAQVSVAYRCKVDPRPGTTDDGRRFDQRQTDIVWNSLASEPLGRAGTARVLGPRLDGVPMVTRADAMLEIARAQTPPSKPVYFDRRHWVRFDSTQATPSRDTPKKDADPMLKPLMMMLLKAHGMAEADLAERLGVPVDQLLAMLSGEAEMTEDQMAAIIEAIMPSMDAGDGGMAKVMIEDEEFEVPAKVAAMLAKQDELLDMASKRADRAVTAKADAEKKLAERADAMGDMVTRADADKMVADAGAKFGAIISLARQAHGADWSPKLGEDRKDSLPTLRDWQIGVLQGVHGDAEAQSIIDRIDARPEAVRDELFSLRVEDAQEQLIARADKSGQVRASVARAQEAVKTHAQARADGSDRLAKAKANQAAIARGETIEPQHGAA